MPTVYVGLDIEEIAFIPVLKVLSSLEGVARVHANFDEMFTKRKRQPKTNGAAPEPAPAASRTPPPPGGLKTIIISALFEKSATRAELSAIAARNGYAAASAPSAIQELKNDGHIDLDNHVYSLSAKTREAVEEHRRGPTPALALPAPSETSPAGRKVAFKDQGLAIILRFFAQHHGPATTKTLRTQLDAAQLPERTLGNSLQDGKNEKLLENVGLGMWKATAKGLKRAEANQQNG